MNQKICYWNSEWLNYFNNYGETSQMYHRKIFLEQLEKKDPDGKMAKELTRKLREKANHISR